MTGPASRRPTSCGSGRRPVAGARTATTRGLVRSSRYICMSWSRTGGGGWGWRGSLRRRRWRRLTGLDSAAWTGNEFGGAPLGDQRLSARLVKSAGLLASLPGEAVTANASHDRAAVKGYYRLIDQPVSSAVTPGNILAPHRARTLQRMRGQDTVLWCARLTGEGAGESPAEGRITNHLHPESCAGRCEAAGEALTGARTGRAIEHRKRGVWSAETVTAVEGNTDITATVRGWRAPRCRRTHARSYVLRRDLGGLHSAPAVEPGPQREGGFRILRNEEVG